MSDEADDMFRRFGYGVASPEDLRNPTLHPDKGINLFAPTRPELRADNDRPWWDRAAYWAADKTGYDRPQDVELFKKLIGPQNPLNFPAQIQEGMHTTQTGYRQGDPAKTAAGVVETAFGALPVAAGANRVVGNAINRALAPGVAAMRAERGAWDLGPWGKHGESVLQAERDMRPMPIVNDINTPLPAKRPTRDQILNEYDAIRDEAVNFTKPGYGATKPEIFFDPFKMGWYERQVPAPAKGRWNYPERIPRGTDEEIADAVLRHAYNNEHIPGHAEKGEDIAKRLLDVSKKQREEMAAYEQAQTNWLRHIDEGQWTGMSRYSADAKRHGIPAQYIESMEDLGERELRRLLERNYGMKAEDPKSIQAAYDAFWNHEREALANKRPTHAQDVHDDWLRAEREDIKHRTGLDPADPKNQQAIDAWHAKEMERIGQEIAERKKRLGVGPKVPETIGEKLRNVAQDPGEFLRKVYQNPEKIAFPLAATSAGALGAKKIKDRNDELKTNRDWTDQQRIRKTYPRDEELP